MKNKTSIFFILFLFLTLFLPTFLFAQVPQGIPYQAMIRNSDGSALMNTNVTVRFTLHQNTTTGAVEYQETQALVTNAFGLINAVFGQGTAVQGTFAAINWSNATKFIQVEANDGNGYVDMGTQQMMSVPYAMYAGSAGNQSFPNGSTNGEMLYWDTDTESWISVPAGINGQAMYFCDGVPTWGGCVPVLGNVSVSSITPYTAYAEFPMVTNGGSAPTTIGFYLSTSSDVSPSNGQFLGGTWPGCSGCFVSNSMNSLAASLPGGNGTVISGNDGATSISNLTPNTQYYIVGSVSNAKGSSLTPVLSFSTPELIEGCMDVNACNFSASATYNVNCEYAQQGYDCDGMCTIDEDGDGICDVEDSFICAADIDNDMVCDNEDQCTDVNACNFNFHAFDDMSGTYECRYDTDGDGICPINPDFIDFTESDWYGLMGLIGSYGAGLNLAQDAFDYCEDVTACNFLGNGNLQGTVMCITDWNDLDGGLLGSWVLWSQNNGFLENYQVSNGNFFENSDLFGCAYDSDNDGICDILDQCRDLNACNYSNVNNEWCFPDIDSDGVCDNLDACYDVQACNYNSVSINEECGYENSSCDDGNTNTILDVYDADCQCAGTSTAANVVIGQDFQGGKVAYIFQPGDAGYVVGETHGLIAAAEDLPLAYKWGCYGFGISGADALAISNGAQNTLDIMNAGCLGAAQECANLVLNGYSDWFLPSLHELEQLYNNRATIGGFQNLEYWSSTETNSQSARSFNFGSGSSNYNYKDTYGYVRAVRAF